MEEFKRVIHACLDEHEKLTPSVRGMDENIARGAGMLSDLFVAGKRLLLCGNGGSAADAQHIAAEFSGRYLLERAPWDAIALHANTSALTALGNDYGYDDVFERQVHAHGREGDILIAISTSGNSPNIIKALQAAHANGMRTIGLTGEGGGAMAPHCDVLLAVASKHTPRIQEMHILIGHILCEIVEADVVKRTGG